MTNLCSDCGLVDDATVDGATADGATSDAATVEFTTTEGVTVELEAGATVLAGKDVGLDGRHDHCDRIVEDHLGIFCLIHEVHEIFHHIHHVYLVGRKILNIKICKKNLATIS